MEVSFTGTQIGMAKPQHRAFGELLLEIRPHTFRHGICVGADAQAHLLVRMLANCIIVGHPGITKDGRKWKRDDFIQQNCDWVEAPEEFLKRNHRMVDMSELLIATPKEDHEILRSGTWATIRYARKINKKVTIILPDGTLI
jgi:hypothetical protein